MMVDTILITPGMPYQTVSGVARGVVGAVAIDEAGCRYGLSARHILCAENDKRIYTSDGTSLLGIAENLSAQMVSSEGTSFAIAIATFIIDDEAISAEMTTELGSISQTVRASDAIGANAIIIGADLLDSECLVNASGMEIFVQDPQDPDKLVVYENAVEILFSGAPSEGYLRGKGGALVVTSVGQALGLLIAVVGHRGYVAPLDDFLQIRGLTLICNSAGAKYVLHPGPNALVEVWKSDLGQVAIGVEAMRQEFAADVRAEEDAEVFEFEPEMVEELGL